MSWDELSREDAYLLLCIAGNPWFPTDDGQARHVDLYAEDLVRRGYVQRGCRVYDVTRVGRAALQAAYGTLPAFPVPVAELLALRPEARA